MDWRDQLSGMKSNLPEGEDSTDRAVEKKADSKQKEPLRIELDKRKGKLATLITDFQGSDEALKDLAKLLKIQCGAGGSSRDGEILIQGDFRQKLATLLLGMGYKVKRINFK